MNSHLLDLIEPLAARSVQTVFEEMLGIPVAPDGPATSDPALGQIIGSAGFVGRANAVVRLGTNLAFANVITARMLGLPETQPMGDTMLHDAIGELSNVVVGNIKSRLSDQGWPCTLTLPSVVRGRELAVGDTRNLARRVLGFRNCNHRLVVELVLKEEAAP